MTKSTYEYVLFRVCHGTRRYKAVQGSTRKVLSRYMAVHFSFYPGLWRFMAVQGCTLTGFAQGGGGWRPPIWCASESAASPAQSVAIASSHSTVIACTNSLIHHLVRPPLGAAPFLAAGCAASGAALSCVAARELSPRRDRRALRQAPRRATGRAGGQRRRRRTRLKM